MLIIITTFVVIALFAIQWYLRRIRLSNLSQRYVLITGCDSGFGSLLVKKLDSLHINVLATCYTHEGVQGIRATSSARVVPIQLDITNQESVDSVCKDVKSLLPPNTGLWALVNNAGIFGSSALAPTEWCTVEDFQEVMNFNLYGHVRMILAFLPMIRKAKGRIVNMTSVSGRAAIGGAPYVCSKFGAEGLADILRVELYKTGVTVHVIEPSGYRTPIVSGAIIHDVMCKRFNNLDDERKQYYGEDFLNKFCRSFDYDRNMSTNLGEVIDAYTHAVTAWMPKARYVVGLHANTFYRFLWTAPEWLSSCMLSAFLWPIPEGCKKRNC